jgi:hypothetical protein
MQFRLLYEGEIRSRQNINVGDLHKIRMALHPQIKALWNYKPLSDHIKHLRETCPEGDIAILERANDVLFAPLITQNNNMACEIDVTLLRQQAPGQLLGDGGDLDNRIKTLFDALRKPSTQEAQQAKITSLPNDEPIHCLLQDDALVLKVSVETDRLLRPASNPYDLVAIIQVRVVLSRVTFGTIGLLSRAQ